jgi:hypothetical protein
MAKQTITLHMYTRTAEFYPAGNVTVFDADFRSNPSCMKGLVWLGSQDVELDVPEVDIRQAQIDALEAQIQQERADSQVRVNLLLERISKLQAIGHDK